MDFDHLNSLPLLEINALFNSNIQKTIQCQRRLLHRFYTYITNIFDDRITTKITKELRYGNTVQYI